MLQPFVSVKHLSVQIRISKKSLRNPVNNENAPQKTGEEFGPLCLFAIYRKKVPGKTRYLCWWT
jgi:hypothetical protein